MDENTDKNIGREWNSQWGIQVISERLKFNSGDMYEVKSENGDARRYSVDKIEDVIKRNEFDISPEGLQKRAARDLEYRKQEEIHNLMVITHKMTDKKIGMPRKYNVKSGAQAAFEEKKKASGAKNVGVYLSGSTLSALQYWKNITGFGATEIFNRVLENSFQNKKFDLLLVNPSLQQSVEFGGRNTGIYLSEDSICAIDYLTGGQDLSRSKLLYRIMENSKIQAALFVQLIDFDFDNYYETAAELFQAIHAADIVQSNPKTSEPDFTP